MLEKFFKLTENKTTVKTEVIAGITTFMTMAYILVVNPGILSATGMSQDALFTATAISAVIGTLVMALWAKLPFALAPGMGLNAFFAFTVCIGMGCSWQFALTAVLIEGVIFLLLTGFNIRELIINSIPMNVKHAISAGIGLFIAFIGLQNGGVIVNHDATLVSLGDLSSPAALVCIFGFALMGVLLVLRVKGALLLGIIGATVLGYFLGLTNLPENGFISTPPSVEPIFFQFVGWEQIFSWEMLVVLFTFLFIDMFDTVGTLIGVSTKAGMLDSEGRVPRVKQALFADAIGTTCGAMLGTSTVTTYVESASGVSEGGRTGLTALVVAGLFAIALFFAPTFLMVPGAATAPALIMVGCFMISPILKINFEDYSEAIPAFITIIMMPLTYSIADGIVFGILAFVFLKLCSGKFKEVSMVSHILSVLFIIWIISKYFSDDLKALIDKLF